nr:hypothetical protein [Tanacetum cinerariifolium]
MADAKEMWEAIKFRFGGNDESKKMQKYLLKRQFKGFYVSTLEGLHKGYDRSQTLLSQLEIHGASVSHKDANQKFLRSLPSSWSQVALIMRTKPGLDTLSFNDLYNNLRVFEHDVKGTTASSSNTQNVAFVSADNTSSTNDVSTAYSVSSPSVLKSRKGGSSSYADEVIHSFFANQSSAPQLGYDDLEQINDDDMEEIDLKWQGILLETAELKGIKPAEKEMLGTMETKIKTMEDAQNYAIMAYSSSNLVKAKLGFSLSSCTLDTESLSLSDSYSSIIGASVYTLGSQTTFSVLSTSSGIDVVVSTLELDSQEAYLLVLESDSSTEEMMNLINSNQDPPVDLYHLERSDKGDIKIDSLTKKPLDTLLTGDEVINTTLERENNQFIKSSVDDLVPILKKSEDDPHRALKDKRIIDTGCSMHITRNIAHLADYQEFKGGSVAFGGSN